MKKRRILSICLAALMLALCPAARAEPGKTATATEYSIRESYLMPLAQRAEDMLPSELRVTYIEDANYYSLQCPVSWSIPTMATPTDYEVRGVLSLPEWMDAREGFTDVTTILRVQETVEVTAASLSIFYYFPLPLGGDPASLGLPAQITVGSRSFSMELDCNWDYSRVDRNTPGSYPVSTRITLPEGIIYTNVDEPLDITVYAVVYDPAGQPAERVDPVGSFVNDIVDVVLVPTGMSTEELAEYLEWKCLKEMNGLYTPDGSGQIQIGIGVSWDLTKVDTSVPGEYDPFIYDLPNGFYLAQRPPMRVQVVDKNFMDLTFYAYESTFGYYFAVWWKELDDPSVWVRIDEGEWEVDDTEFYAHVDPTRLRIDSFWLEEGHTYSFRVHDGEARSNILVIDMTNGKPEITLVGGDTDGGDRDEQKLDDIQQPPPGEPPSENDQPTQGEKPASGGNDTSSGGNSSNNPSSYGGDPWRPGAWTGGAVNTNAGLSFAWTAPDTAYDSWGVYYAEPYQGVYNDANNSQTISDDSAPYAPAAGTPALLEQVTDTVSVLSGLRLMEMMRAQPQAVLFQKGLLSLWIPTEQLMALAPGERELFSVLLVSHAEGSFAVEVMLGGYPIKNIPGMRMRIPLSLPEGERGDGLLLQSEAGAAAYDLLYDDTLKFLTFTIDSTGVYTFSSLPAAQSDEELPYGAAPINAPIIRAPDPTPFVMAGCAMALVFACVALHAFRRRMRHA